ncbi:MAG: acylphosphatase [Pseudomonadota bacterium]
MRPAAVSNHRRRLVIRGKLASPTFLPWVKRHSRRLGLKCQNLHADPALVEFNVEGQTELIDALEVGCLLGPIDVWVDSVEQHPAAI